jgi:hypothetical protein
MKKKEILDRLRERGFLIRQSWNKDYGNGTVLVEFYLYSRPRQRKPTGFIQVGYSVSDDTVIGASARIGQESYEIETLVDLDDLPLT